MDMRRDITEDKVAAKDKIFAPWTEEQVASLNGYQNSGVFHPFTGPRKADGEEDVLVATRDGWISKHNREYHQVWAWAWMADRRWEQDAKKFPRFRKPSTEEEA